MIAVELPDGRVVEFPDGTSRDDMRAAMNKLAMRERVAAAKSGTLQMEPAAVDRQAGIDMAAEQNMRDPGAGRAMLAGATRGSTFGFGDEILGGMDAVVSAGSDILNGNLSGMGGRMADRYSSFRDIVRDEYENASFARPKTTMGAEIVGGAIPALGGAGLAVKAGTSLPMRAGLGAAAGAGEGSLYGFGTGEGGAGNRLAEAGKMAVIGAAGGAAAPLAIAGLGAAKNAVVNPVMSALNIPSDLNASKAIQKMLARAGMSADDAQRAITQAADEGQDVFRLADALGPTGQRGLAGIARQPSDDARREIADFLTQRQGGQADRLTGFVANALEAPDTAAARVAALTKARGDAAGVAYDAARTGAAPVDVRGALGVIDDRLGPMSGMGVTGDGIDKTLSTFRNRLAAPDTKLPNGASAVELSDFDRVLKVKQDLGDEIGAAVRAGRNNEARELMKLQAALDQSLEGASPAYRSANDEFAKASRVIDAVDQGKAAVSGRVRADDTAASWAKMTPEQQRAFRAGYADPVIARIENAAEGVNKARPLSSGKTGADMGTLAVDPELIRRQIARENTMFETGNAALGGSKTADNLADAKDMGALSQSPIWNLISGNWGAAGRQVMDRAASAATGSNPATRELIARALLSQNPNVAVAPAAKRAAMLEGPRQAIEAMIRSGTLRGAQ